MKVGVRRGQPKPKAGGLLLRLAAPHLGCDLPEVERFESLELRAAEIEVER